MTQLAAASSAVLTAQYSLLLASMGYGVETQLVMEWLGQQRARNPDAKFDVLTLPADASPSALSLLVDRLASGEDRAIMPVRVFWLPTPDRGRVAKLAGLLPGWDPYHPKPRRQRHIVRNDPHRARVVAGEAATVSELR